MTWRHTDLRMARAIVNLAARLAPGAVRRDFRREWLAELTWAEQTGARHGAPTPVLALTLRSLGALPHAAWWRWDQWRLEMLRQDLVYAVRTLLRRPGFAVTAVLTLGLGIGANAAMYSAVRAVLLRPLPFPEPERVLQISSTTRAMPNLPGGSASPSDFDDWHRQSTQISTMAAVVAGSVPFSGHGEAEQIQHASVTGEFFAVLAVPALLGRPLDGSDAAAGAEETVVIAHELWRRRFRADPNVIGQTMVLDSMPRRVVGVMPAGFSYPLASELWLPLRFSASELATQRGAQYLDVIGRLAADSTIAAAQAEMSDIARRLGDLYPNTNRDKAVTLFGLREALVGSVRTPLVALVGAVGFVLLIVCVNLASLTLTRAVGRRRELAVRMALGAGRARLVSGLLVESVLVACAGGLVGVTVAYLVAPLIAGFDTGLGIPLLDQTRIDGPVLVFTALATLGTAVLSGTLPAWHASGRIDVGGRIRDDATTITAGRERQRLRGGLIIVETALAVVLLIGAGLLLRSVAGMTAVHLGFDARGVQTFGISLPETRYPTPDTRAAFVDTLVTALEERPDVEHAGAIFGLPLTGFGYVISMSTLDGRSLDNDEQTARSVQVRIVTPSYFRAMGIDVVRGRPFDAADRRGRDPVVLVNESAAARLWPGENPIGHSFALGTRMGQGGDRVGGTVVGVVADVRDHGPSRPARPTAYFAHAQVPVGAVSIVARTSGDGSALAEPARQLLQRLDPDIPAFRVRTMERLVGNATAQPRLYFVVLALFAATAVVLAALGIYGVLTHAVAERRREIGLRLALGADRVGVVGMVVRQAATLAAAGLVLGLMGAAMAARAARGLLFNVEPIDAATYAVVATVLMAVVLLAAYLPARRAARIDPSTALRG